MTKKEYNRQYYLSHREEIRVNNKRYYIKNRKRMLMAAQTLYQKTGAIRQKLNRTTLNKRRTERAQERRLAVIQKYGNKCKKCGFNDHRALCIDHVNGGGRLELRRYNIHSYYKRLLETPRSKKYQVLCANCNLIKARKRNEFSRRF